MLIKGFVYALQLAPLLVEKIDIFFLELGGYHVLQSTMLGHSPQPPPVACWSGQTSLDAVGVLNSLHATESLHNAPLLAIAQVILRTGMDLSSSAHIEEKKECSSRHAVSTIVRRVSEQIAC